MILRDLVGGSIKLKPTARELVAQSALHRNVLVRGPGAREPLRVASHQNFQLTGLKGRFLLTR
jgi:hypothetical protein